MQVNILVTGANGFVGGHLVRTLRGKGYSVKAATRADYGDLYGETNWAALLQDITHIVHCAATVHQPQAPLEAFERVNIEATQALATQAKAQGVKRLVFLSTVKVMGEGRDAAYTEADTPKPEGGYAVSKLQAEKLLLQMQGLEVSILRPPLVYGEGVGANFLALFKLVAKGIPLPFGLVNNKRSLIYVGNLCAAIEACLFHEKALGAAFLVSDGAAVSTSELVRAMGKALGKRARLLPVPTWMFTLAARLTGKQAAVSRLLGSLHVDDKAIREQLGFSPPFTMDEGLTNTARWFTNGGYDSASRPC